MSPVPDVNDTIAYLTYLNQQVERNSLGANTVWVANCTYLVFLMQTGFTLLEAGSSRHKCYLSSTIKIILDIVSSTIAWWLIGYGLAFGETRNGFIGVSGFALDGLSTANQYNFWMIQWAFAGTSATIVTVLERMKIWDYLLYYFFMVVWIYPLIGKF